MINKFDLIWRYGEKSHTHKLASPEYQLPPKPESGRFVSGRFVPAYETKPKSGRFVHLESGISVPAYEMLTLPASFGGDYSPPHKHSPHFKRKNKFGYKSHKSYRPRYHGREKWTRETRDGSGSSSWEQRDSSKKRPSFRENFSSRKNRDSKRNNDYKRSPPSSYNSRTNRQSDKKSSHFSSFHFQSQSNKASKNERNGKHRQMSSSSSRYSRKINPVSFISSIDNIIV